MSAIAAASTELALLTRAQGVAVSVLKSASEQQVALLEVVAAETATTPQAAGGGRGQQVDLLA